MLVAKFGGTSMKDNEAISRSIEISRSHKAGVVVVSATSGTTNLLLKITDFCREGNWPEASKLVNQIVVKHKEIAMTYHLTETEYLDSLYSELTTLAKGMSRLKEVSNKTLDRFQSIGERLSSYIMAHAWNSKYPQAKVEFLDARSIIKTNKCFGKAVPNIELIKLNCDKLDKSRIYVTQGFIGSSQNGDTTTLGRGGSDYSAALFAEGLDAETLQIWTDVAGIATTDPRICPKAMPIREITFKEAGELATFGAKILHPTTLQPATRKGISVFVGSSYSPNEEGTWIRKSCDDQPLIRAMALKTEQALLTLSTPKMFDTHGFLARVFDIFDKHEVSVDAITTSEISVAVTVEQSVLSNREFINDLETYGQLNIEEKLALVSLIGNNINHTPGLAMNIFSGLHNDASPINVRMICLGASKHNFCMVIDENHAKEAIKRLHRKFIEL